MQRSLLILIFVFCSARNCVQAQPVRPGTEDIVKQFYNVYETENLKYSRVLFEKRKDGWYIVTQKIKDHTLEPDKKYLFYSFLTGTYKIIPLPANKLPEEFEIGNYMDEFELMYYDLLPFYGYRGWYKDVIAELANKKNISDNELYALGRAYSYYAGSFLSDQSGEAILNEIWKLPLKMNCLNKTQISQFSSIQNKAVACFKKLTDRNPGYETRVGSISRKYSNEVVAGFHLLLVYASDFAKSMKLPVLYTGDTVLEDMRKVLESCPADAIYLSFGDNDFYPTLYLQHVLGIRRDVHLINYSLLALDRFIYRTGFPQLDANGIKYSADTSLYTGERNEFFYREDSTREMEFSGLISFLQRNLHNDLKVLKSNALVLRPAADTSRKQHVSLLNSKYLLKNQWLLLDMIHNLGGRKICFQYEFVDELSGLNEHLVRKDGIYVFDN
jgi:hypothetical protein